MNRVVAIGWGLAFVVSAGALASCGGRSQPFVSNGLVVSARSPALLGAEPRSVGPGLGPAHPFFLNARRGYAATTGGAWDVPKTGVAPPVAPAEIDETFDGGASWRVLVRERHAAFDAIAFSGRFGYALGSHERFRVAPAPVGHLVFFALATNDGGASWQTICSGTDGGASADEIADYSDWATGPSSGALMMLGWAWGIGHAGGDWTGTWYEVTCDVRFVK